jgi:hypothetical protein
MNASAADDFSWQGSKLRFFALKPSNECAWVGNLRPMLRVKSCGAAGRSSPARGSCPRQLSCMLQWQFAFFCAPCCIRERCVNVFRLGIWIQLQHCRFGMSHRQQADNCAHRHPQVTNARLSPHPRRIEGNPLQVPGIWSLAVLANAR